MEDPANCGRRDGDVEASEFTLDALIAPSWVLAGETHDRVADLRVVGWPTWASMRIRPMLGDEPAMPRQQRRGFHQEDAPTWPGKDPTRRGKEDTVDVAKLRATHLPPQHPKFVT
jgi:hypothetical protein